MSFLDGYPDDLSGWTADARISERGFAHPWQSQVGAGNGEIFFDELVRGQLSPDLTVADIGCGHGDYTMRLAASTAHVIGLDRDPDAISLARTLAAERQLTNVTFLDAEAGSTAVPPIDLFICRRGPVLAKWLPWALTAAHPGAVILGIHPTGQAGAVPAWNSELPPALQLHQTFDHAQVLDWVTSALVDSPARLHSSWWLDVPEVLDSPTELHARLTGTRSTPDPSLQALLDHHGGSLELRHCRLVWKVVLP